MGPFIYIYTHTRARIENSFVPLNRLTTGPEELPVQSVSCGWPEDPHGDGPQLY